MKMPKLRKLSNKALIESALDNLQKDSKMHFYNIEFGNSYFVFDLGKNSICHFKIKEIPGFIFAIWTKSCFNSEQFNCSDSDELIIFSQFERYLDKFKPSRSGLQAFMGRYVDVRQENQETLDLDNIKKSDYREYWNNWDALKMLKFMRKHHFVARYYSYYSEIYFSDYVYPWKALKECIHEDIYHYRTHFIEFIKRKFTVWSLIFRLRKLPLKCILSDYGEDCSPRLHLYILEDTKLTLKEENKLNKFFKWLEDYHWNDVSFFYIDSLRKYKSIVYNRKKCAEEKEETFLWEKI